MSLPGSYNRFHEGSYVEDKTDMWTGYVGEVPDARGQAGGTDTVHIREQTQVERDLPEDGAEGGGSLEDGAGQVPGTGHIHLHEAGGIDGHWRDGIHGPVDSGRDRDGTDTAVHHVGTIGLEAGTLDSGHMGYRVVVPCLLRSWCSPPCSHS